ncbi:MAG: alpha/beta fold hydrolase [Anaerolineae bacterium]|nr:alpha/beta fold hydrolase [Anaerolineae bacterium]
MITEDFVEFRGYKVWYRLVKPVTPDPAAPLLLLHGGPGGSSDIFEPLEALAEQGRTVIRFDQLGCGRSDRPRDVSLWTIASCIEQVECLRKALEFERIHLLGHSWGSMLAIEYLLTCPPGVQSVCLSSAVISAQLWTEEARRLRSQLPGHIARALERCEKSYHPRRPPQPGAEPAPAVTQEQIDQQARRMHALFPFISHPWVARLAGWMSYLPPFRPAAYEILGIQFVLRHICRLRPMPLGMFKMLAGTNGEIYETLWGPSEFLISGLLKEWDIRPQLAHIHLPTLILSGRYDEATPAQMAILKEGIADSEQIILEQSSHCGMWEEPDKYRAAVLDFINRVEFAAA